MFQKVVLTLLAFGLSSVFGDGHVNETTTEEQIEGILSRLKVVEEDKLDTQDADAFWLLFGMILVFFMQAGFAMLEVGSVQVKNTKNILIKNIFDATVAALFWWLSGYAFAFGPDAFKDTGKNGFIGGAGFLYEGEGMGDDASPLTNTPTAKTYDKAFWMFQWAFAGAAATIVSGAVAERCSFGAYLTYSMVLSGFIYPVVVHMGWSGDGKFSPWRTNRLVGGCGMIDFAGSGVVHMTGGIASLVASIFVGPRKGRFGPNAVHLEQQSAIFQSLGVLILWVGWYGFNGVSTLAIAGYGGLAAHVMMTTTISAATACLTTTILGYACTHIIDPSNANNGILAGLVSITAGCATSNLYGAFFTGLIGGPVYYAASKALELFEIDDVVDAFPVHGCCGCWGVIAAALFATEYYYNLAYYSDDDRKDDCAGAFYGGDGGSLGAGLLFILTDIAWTGTTMTILLSVLQATIGVRVSSTVEEIGMDESKHGGHVDVPLPSDGAALKKAEAQKVAAQKAIEVDDDDDPDDDEPEEKA